MKVIRLTNFLDFGGIERRLVNLSHYQGTEVEIIFIAIGKGGEAAKLIIAQNKVVKILNLPHRIPSWQTIKALKILFLHLKPDVVHTSGAEANFHGILAATWASVPVRVAEEIGVPQQGKIAKLIISIIYKLSNVVIGNAQPVVNFLKTNYNLPSDKIKQVANPLLFPDLPPRSLSPNHFEIISVSRLDPIKNIPFFIKGMASIHKQIVQKNIRYTVIGEGPQRNALEALVDELNIKEQVNFIGFQEQPLVFLRKSNLFVLTSFTEGFSNALVEAMYAEVPVLATAVGAAPEIIQDGVNGFLIPSDDEKALELKLLEILSLPLEHLEAIGKAGHEKVKAQFSLENHMKTLKQIYSLGKD
ncbi:glycosyltransferase [Penaeicola halotolerans]|uniref:glycosyltransferase n=1 Tax=Penaeicola halotolerans TaxID=2793196 RepID=UPI001CF83953|nr:glycosyltransferase [Penaeicola halotolerans]